MAARKWTVSVCPTCGGRSLTFLEALAVTLVLLGGVAFWIALAGGLMSLAVGAL